MLPYAFEHGSDVSIFLRDSPVAEQSLAVSVWSDHENPAAASCIQREQTVVFEQYYALAGCFQGGLTVSVLALEFLHPLGNRVFEKTYFELGFQYALDGLIDAGLRYATGLDCCQNGLVIVRTLHMHIDSRFDAYNECFFE